MSKILVTCVGSGVGQSVIDSLNLTGKHITLGCDSNRNVYAYQFCDNFEIVPSIYSEGYLDYLLGLCIKHEIDLVIPGHDHELLLLSKNINKFENNNIEVIVSRPDIIEVSRDKYEWFNYFKKYDCAIVPTYRVDEFKRNPNESFFPAIVKPSGGSASQGISILNKLSELEKAKDSDIIQPYLFPKKDDPNYETIKDYVNKGKFVQMSEISIQLVFSKDSQYEGIFISRNSLKSGVPIFVDPINPEEFEYIEEIMKFVPICQEKKVRGPVNIQGRITEKGLIFFEMNMRFTGITGNRAQLGFNEVEFLVNNFLEKGGVLNGFAKNKLGVRQVACTTISRKSERTKLNFCIYIPNPSSKYIIDEVEKLENCGKISIISDDKHFELFKSFVTKNITLLKVSEPFLVQTYCQSDIFINLNSGDQNCSEEDCYNSILFQYEQLQKIIKSNIPIVVNVINESKTNSDNSINDVKNFQRLILEKFYNSINYHIPATKLIVTDYLKLIGVLKEISC